MAQKNKNRIIVLTGGHAGTTALSIVHEIRSRRLPWKLYWIGAQRAHEGKAVPSLESRMFPRFEVRFIPIRAGKLQRRWSKYTLISLMKVPIGFVDAFRVLTTIKPEIVVSFGGYAAFPVVVSAWIKGIPVLLQEQITGLGFANRLSLPFAEKVSLARAEGLRPSKGKGVVLGNPVNPDIACLSPKKHKHSPMRLFVFAGSRGSQSINHTIGALLPKLLDRFEVIHHTGDLDYGAFVTQRKKLSKTHQKRYHLYSFIDTNKVPYFYENADILIGRAGANTISEIMVVGIPAVVIPLMWTNYQEQSLNAKAAESRNFVRIINQDDLTPHSLLSSIIDIESHWDSLIASQKRDLAQTDIMAASKNVDLLQEMMM